MRNWIFIIGILMLLANTANANVSVNILKGKASGEKNVTLFVSVVDDAGRPIKGLAKDNFKLQVGGEEVKGFTVEPISTAQEPLSIVLGIDISGSMKGKPFTETKKAISIFLDHLDKRDFISLLSLGTEVKFLTDFTNEKHKVRQQVEPLAAVDMETHLYDATYEALDNAKKAPTTRTAVVLLTDGVDEGKKRGEVGSRRTRQEAVDKATGASTPVFTIGFGHKVDRAYLKEVARVSGGYFLFTPDTEKIAGLYSKVLDQLKNQYIISLDFAKEPGRYKANLTLTYEGKTVKDSKEFLFSPEGRIPWYKQLSTKEWLIIGFFVGMVLVGLLIVGFISFKRWNEVKKWRKKVEGGLLPHGGGECYLEYPEESPTAHEFIDSRSGGKTRLATGAQGAFLKIDCLKGQMVPLIHQGREVITELIIARKPEKKGFKKENTVYLWTPSNNNCVSRPKEGRVGHARLFFITDVERFAIEDLNSANGTLINESDIRDKGPVPLINGDVIDVGGKQGIRIVYRESEMEKESHEETTIAGI